MKQCSLGTCIRTLRLQKKLTQRQLADRLGITDKAVSKWERDLSYPDIVLIPKLAGLLGTTVNDLVIRCGSNCRASRLIQAYEISKDIRLPLHFILGFVEIARQNSADPDQLIKYLDIIKVSGEYLMSVLNCILLENDACHEEDSKSLFEKYLQGNVHLTNDKQVKYDFSKKRILVVDDMIINRQIAAGILKQTGAQIEFAEDGQICLNMINTMPPNYYDMILMDIMMPNMDGIEATKKIREMPDERAGIPIIAMTTNVSDNDRETAIEAGMNAFTEKPIFVDKLFAVMDKYLK